MPRQRVLVPIPKPTARQIVQERMRGFELRLKAYAERRRQRIERHKTPPGKRAPLQGSLFE